MSEQKIKIAIIGAGISGMTCAQSLHANKKFSIHVFEKARGVGGRMSTRRIENLHFDHGAQYLKPHTPLKNSLLQPWNEFLVPTPSSNSICKSLMSDINILCNVKIDLLKSIGQKWVLSSENKDLDTFDAVIITAPPMQTFDLLPLDTIYKNDILKARMSPCFTLMIALNTMIPCAWDYLRPKHPTIAWISNESSKPKRQKDVSQFVAQSSLDWANAHLEKNIKDVENELLAAFLETTAIKKNDIQLSEVHRWRYAITQTPIGKTHLWDKKLKIGVCGDWLIGRNIDCAITSAHHLSQDVQNSFL